MKTKIGFISNSSSTSFVIRNMTNDKKDLVDFVDENPQLIEQYVKRFQKDCLDRYDQEQLIHSAWCNNIEFEPNEIKICTFGDEDGTIIGNVFDYILRIGGKSKSFEWDFYEYLR